MMHDRKETMAMAVELIKDVPDPLIVEVGRTRSSYAAETDGFSTIYFNSILNKWNRGHLVSIDIDRDTEVICRAIINSIKQDSGRVSFVNEDALEFFDKPLAFQSLIDLLYLDGWDCDGDNLEMSAMNHLKCFEFAHPYIKPDAGLVLIDDVEDTTIPSGKGRYAVLQAQVFGYEILRRGYQWLLRKTK